MPSTFMASLSPSGDSEMTGQLACNESMPVGYPASGVVEYPYRVNLKELFDDLMAQVGGVMDTHAQ